MRRWLGVPPALPVRVTTILCLAASASPARADGPATTMFRLDARHTGVTSAPLGPHYAGLQWRFATGGPVRSTPAVLGGAAYVGSADGHLYAIDLRTGRQRWRFDAGHAINASPAVAGGRVICAAMDGTVFAVSAERGTVLWRRKTGADLPLAWGHESGDLYGSSPAVSGNTVVIGSGDGRVYALDLATGAVRWSFATGGRVRSSPAIGDGAVYVGSMDGSLYAIALDTGRPRWRFDTDGRALDSGEFGYDRRTVQSSPALLGDLVVFGSRAGFLYAVDRAAGTLRWRFDHQVSWVNVSPAVADGHVWCGTSDGRFFQCVDAATGREVWRDSTLQNIAFASPTVAGDAVVAVDASGTLTVRDRASGATRWRWSVGTQLWASPVVSDSLVLLGGDDGGVYALRTTSGPALQRAVYWDSTRAERASFGAHQRVKTYLDARGYAALDTVTLPRFLAARIADRAPSVVVVATDDLPRSVAPVAADTVLLRRYLDAGGKVVWLGTPPLLTFRPAGTKQGAPAMAIAFDAPRALLGVDTGAGTFHPRLRASPTDEGRTWGLTGWWLATWSADPATVTTVLARDETGLASAWVKRYGGDPGSGFVMLYAGGRGEYTLPPVDLMGIQSAAEYRPR